MLALLRELARRPAADPIGRSAWKRRPTRSAAARIGGTTSPIGDDPPVWRCVVATVRTPGRIAYLDHEARRPRALRRGARRSGARQRADEALLFDAAGRLVEGARSNAIVVRRRRRASPRRRSPAARRRGSRAALLLERVPLLREADILRDELAGAREILTTNAVRGVRPVIALDGRPVGDGRPGPWATRLAATLRDD